MILGLELTDFWGTVSAFRDSLHRIVAVAHPAGHAADQHHRRRPLHEEQLPGLPALSRSGRRHGRRRGGDAAGADRSRAASWSTADRRRAFAERRTRLEQAHARARDAARAEATHAWDASPISTARMAAEIWAQIRNEDWSLVSESGNTSGWAFRLWDFDKHYQHLGDSGGAGVGYGAPAAVGGALANKKHGRLSVNIQGDGDMLYAPGVLWTAAHHQIPLLTVMHNNRGYHQEVMHIQRMANRHQRGITRWNIGTTIDNPNVDFAKIAQGMGVYAEGPIANPQRSRSGAPARARRRQEGRAGARRRRHAAAVRHGHGGFDERAATAAESSSFATCGVRVGLRAQAPAAPAPAQPAPARRQRRGRQEAVGQLRLLAVPWLRRPGRRGRVRGCAPRPLPFAGFSRYVRRPTNQMPPYTEKVVPDADLAHIHAYLMSRPAPPAASSIPLLK